MNEFDADQAKNFLKSKTILGLLATALAWIFNQFFGVTIDEATGAEMANELVNLICGLIEAGGMILAAYGRFAAKAPIKIKSEKAGTIIAGLLAFMVVPALTGCSYYAWADTASPVVISTGGPSSLVDMGLFAGLLNVIYAIGGFLLAVIAWFWVVDPFVLKGFNTQDELKKENKAVAIFAGLGFLGLCLLIGLSLG